MKEPNKGNKGNKESTPIERIESEAEELETAEEIEQTENQDEGPESDTESENESDDLDYKALYNQAQDRYKRAMAEFDNFRKRTTKEMAARYEDGLRAAAEKLLPIIDNFERAMSASENKEDTFYQGISLISRQFDGVLSDIGIEPIIDEPGAAFNHNLHHAVAHVEDETYGLSEIVEILQKGYKHRDRVLRPSMVKVAN